MKRIVDEEQGIVADIEHKTRAFFTRYERSFEGFGFEGLLDIYALDSVKDTEKLINILKRDG